MNIIDWKQLNETEQQQCLLRPVLQQPELTEQVRCIIETVQQQGDQALIDLTKQYDHVQLQNVLVTEQEWQQAETQIAEHIMVSIQQAVNRIEHYQQSCLPSELIVDTQDGIICRRIPKPIKTVGLYVPAGTAPLISTLMMLAVPAKIAGCAQRVLCMPPNQQGTLDTTLLITAKLCGIDTVIKAGGAQAIAAMAYGTESVPKVDKLFGPGNAWVTAAKQQVAQDPKGASIDMPAGPSEVLVIADQSANADFIAADLLSQAEHGVDSQVIFITPDPALAQTVVQCIATQSSQLNRQAIIAQSLANSRIIVVDTLEQAFAISNRYAPEHLILQIAQAQQYIDRIEHAGAVFIGEWTPETMGDYINGSNHVLPTYGYANRSSGLSVVDFMKYMSVQTVSAEGLKELGPYAMTLAEIEGLLAHKNAVQIRLDYLRGQDV